jgi:hypothetical protein
MYMQILLENSRDIRKLELIRKKLAEPDGGIYKGTLPPKEWADRYLGDAHNKVILASTGIEKLGTPQNEFTAIGGWCAIRTKCFKSIAQGWLIDQSTGRKTKITSVSQVADWIENSVSADQIVEAIGIYNGTIYTAISEIKLWTQKVADALKIILKRELNKGEVTALYTALQIGESKRQKATKKYLEYILNKKINLTIVKDEDIFEDLIEGRNLLLKSIGTSLEELVEPTINRIVKQRKLKNLKNGNGSRSKMLSYIDKYSIVWFMYTGPYLKLLQKKGYVKTPKGLIIEPWEHSSGHELEAKALFNYKVFGKNNGENNYLVEDSINEDLAIIGIDEVSEYNWQKSKLQKYINEVPNLRNYKSFMDLLEMGDSNLDLTQNISFILGVNYLPYGTCKNYLEEMIQTRDEYRLHRKTYKSLDVEDRVQEINLLRSEKSTQMKDLSLKINQELYKVFKHIFSE